VKKLLVSALVLGAGQNAFSAVVASQLSCQDLRTIVAAGEREVVGKNGKVYNLETECGSSFIFKTANGLCSVFVPGTNPEVCHDDDPIGGAIGGNN
jgi:hypothetical protein